MNSNSKILVVGGTGMLGAPVARKLRDFGFDVRILSRTPERAHEMFSKDIEIVEGNLNNPKSIENAMEGCDGVHINLLGGPDPESFDKTEHLGSVLIANLAKKNNLKQLTYLSGAPVHSSNFHDPGTKAKYDAEEGIKKSGVPYTIFRATWMMESLDLFIRWNRAIVLGKQPHKLRWVAANDFGEIVAKAFQNTATYNKTFYVFGPEAYSKPEALAIYLKETNSKAKLTFLPIWLMKIIALISFDPQLKTDVKRMAYYNKIGDDYGSSEETEALFGATQTTLTEWSKKAANNV